MEFKYISVLGGNKENMIKYNKTFIIIIIIVISIFAFRIDIKVVKYDIKSDKVTDTIKIALITDLHSCDYGENQEKLLSSLYFQEPDIILLGGDIVDDKLTQNKAREFLSVVSEKYQCFYVSGNHEYWSGDIDNIKKMIKNYGIQVLEGESITIEKNGQKIDIFGIDDPEVGEREFDQQLKKCGDNINNSVFSILLSHRPEFIESYEKYEFDLILSGHAHGGQWRIPGVLNGLLAPNQGFFPKYAGGFYQLDNTSMIVSRGLAKESTRIPRIFNRPEIVIVNVIAEDSL